MRFDRATRREQRPDRNRRTTGPCFRASATGERVNACPPSVWAWVVNQGPSTPGFNEASYRGAAKIEAPRATEMNAFMTALPWKRERKIRSQFAPTPQEPARQPDSIAAVAQFAATLRFFLLVGHSSCVHGGENTGSVTVSRPTRAADGSIPTDDIPGRGIGEGGGPGIQG